jgi:hypothetical protein
MVTNRLGFAALGLTCIVAAGGGAYLASRQNANDLVTRSASVTAQAQADQGTAAATDQGTTTPKPATETEAVIGEATTPRASAPAPAEAPEAAVAPAATAPRSAARPVRESPRRTSSAPRASTAPQRKTPAPTIEPSRTAAPSLSGEADAPRPIEPTPAPVETAAAPPVREPQKTFEELVVQPDSVIGVEIESTLTSERARIEDRVEARVTRDVRVGDRVAIPAGSRMVGSVTQVERGGKVRERARLGVRFHTLVLDDGSRVPVSTDTLYRDGVAPTKESAAKIGGATVGGAILGAILGGGKGAAAGAAAGAAGGTAAVMAGDRNPAVLPAGSTVTVRVLSPVTITVEK